MGKIIMNGNAYGSVGSDVEANPQGTATDTLNTIGIDNVIYEIQGGGSGGNYKEQQLYTATSTSRVNISVTWDWDDYDAYIFRVWDEILSSNGGGGDTTILTKNQINNLITNENPQFFMKFSEPLTSYYFESNQITFRNGSSDWVINEIIGLKFGGGGNVDDVYVNGTSVLDSSHIAQITSYKEVTKAQYDAIPNKDNDNILYCITDEGEVIGDNFNPIIYSLEEREVGTWIDGKPLYQKTYDLSSEITVSNTDWTSTGIAASNLDIETYVKCSAQNSSGTCWDAINVATTDSNISLTAWRNGDTIGVKKFTIQYTKITDVPGAAQYTSFGVPAVHYSTDEQVIGTWIDGKPLYRRTFYYDNQSGLISGDNKIIQLDSVINVTKVDGFLVNPDNNRRWILPYSKGSSTTAVIITDDHYINLYVNSDSWASTRKVYITIEYTKTTS